MKLSEYLAKYIEQEAEANSNQHLEQIIALGLIKYNKELADKDLPNIPVECENRECHQCPCDDETKAILDCPYVVY